MASNSVYVRDTWAALAAGGVFPGQFSDDGATYTFPRVTTTDARGANRHWTVEVHLLGPDQTKVPFNSKEMLAQPVPELEGYVGIIKTESWHEGGDAHLGKVPTRVESGRNLGKANATNVATQALRDALGLYNKKMKAAGKKTVKGPQLAQAHIPMPKPMLVKKIGSTKAATLTEAVFRRGVTVQRKFNGVRAVAFLEEAEAAESRSVVIYSRGQAPYNGMPTLRGELADLLSCAREAWTTLCAKKGRDPWDVAVQILTEKGEPPSPAAEFPQVNLDGELYLHGKSLRWISGQSRGTTTGSELQFWVYDCFFPQLAAASIPVVSATRQAFLDILFDLRDKARASRERPGPPPKIRRVENFPVPKEATPEDGLERVYDLAAQFVKEGYEGAIARKDDAPYRYGTNNYHSDNLVKVKPLHDKEFTCVGFTQGDRGKDVGAVIWICEVPAEDSPTGQAERFNVVPKNMTYETRYRIFQCLQEEVPGPDGSSTVSRFDRDFKGLPLTVEYPELSSKTGKPTQAKALMFRTYDPALAGTGVHPDPIGKLLEECPPPQ